MRSPTSLTSASRSSGFRSNKVRAISALITGVSPDLASQVDLLFQQRLQTMAFATVILLVPSNRLKDLVPLVDGLHAAIRLADASEVGSRSWDDVKRTARRNAQ